MPFSGHFASICRGDPGFCIYLYFYDIFQIYINNNIAYLNPSLYVPTHARNTFVKRNFENWCPCGLLFANKPRVSSSAGTGEGTGSVILAVSIIGTHHLWNITVISHRRHGVSNHMWLDGLLNSLSRMISKEKHRAQHYWIFVKETATHCWFRFKKGKRVSMRWPLIRTDMELCHFVGINWTYSYIKWSLRNTF